VGITKTLVGAKASSSGGASCGINRLLKVQVFRRSGPTERVVSRWRAALCLFALFGAAGLVVSACGGSSPGSSTARTTRPSSTGVTSTSVSPTEAAVLAAYRASWSAFERALAEANPNAPTLAATMVDPQLQGVKANLLSDQIHGMIGRGTFTLHPKITSITATTATVVDCAYSSAELVYKATGKPVPPITPPENDGVTSTLVLTGGVWKVSKQIVTDGSCVSGS
jgi:hypothetical protein